MEVEKNCEFCRLLRPVVYCKADAARLCLPCDAKVHTANALSGKHCRTLICELCRYHPAHVRCSDHQMFLCRGCDCSQHDFSSEHEKRVVGGFTGCPSAKDLAALWGFDLNELENSTLFVSTSNVPEVSGGCNMNVPRQFSSQIAGTLVVSTVESLKSTVSAKSNLRSRSKHTKDPIYKAAFKKRYMHLRMLIKGKASRKIVHQGKDSLVLQQILDLKRLQLCESGFSSLMHAREPTNASSSRDGSSRKLHDSPEYLLQHSDVGSDLQNVDGFREETSEKPFPSTLSQLDQLTDTGNSSNGDSFWQYKSPLQNNQLWPQNMQDLGVCDELRCLDDVKMPDFDLTFQNFEEIFGGEQDLSGSLLDDNDMPCLSVANQPSIGTSEDTDVQQSPRMEKDSGMSNQDLQFHQTTDNLTPTQPSHLLSHQTLISESSRDEYVESRLSQTVVRHEHSCHSGDAERAHVVGGETVTIRHKERSFRRDEKQVPYRPYKKSKSDVKNRVKRLFIKAKGYESDSRTNVARGF